MLSSMVPVQYLLKLKYIPVLLFRRGLVVETAEREVIAKDLGPNNKVMYLCTTLRDILSLVKKRRLRFNVSWNLEAKISWIFME